MVALLTGLVERLVVDAVVGEEHDEQVVPIGCGLELGDKVAQTVVQIAERILNLIKVYQDVWKS